MFSASRRAEVEFTITLLARIYSAIRRKVWREDNRRVSNGDQVSRVAALAMKVARASDSRGNH